MKKYIKFFIIMIIGILIVGVIYLWNKKNDLNKLEETEHLANENTQIDKNQTSYKEDVTINELKDDIGAVGDEKIYDIVTEYDGRKILSIKPNIQFNVVLAGIIENKLPEKKPKDVNQYYKNFGEQTGIWIDENSRNKFMELLKDITESEYFIDGNGYLIKSSQNGNEFDEKIQEILSGEKLYIISISGKCYVVDEISGEIVEYPFEQMDPYQIGEFYEMDNKKILVLTTNKNKKLTNKEIIENIVFDK